MAVNLTEPGPLLPVGGIRLGTAAAGVRAPDRDDLLLLACDAGTSVAALFTRNAFCAAPVTLCRQRLAERTAVHGLLINAGNANAGTGAAGLDAARQCAAAAETQLEGMVLPFSTGVIGEALPVARISSAVPRAAGNLRADGWLAAARAIMTTDTVPKGCSRQLEIGGRTVTITGIAKGAGMICPDMATMLAFVATDAAVSRSTLQRALAEAAADSFNAITVDGDTSTNDSLVLMATGASGAPALAPDSDDYARFLAALQAVCGTLAQAVVRDGEGATRFITVRVEQARDRDEARRVAYTLAHSPLFKTAAFAGDANWGRILAAVGRAPVDALDLSRVTIAIDDVPLVAAGEPHPDYSEAAGSAVFARAEFTVRIQLGRGRTAAEVYTCDFSYDYVRINAEYRS
ncbi:bifunctional glutamate N-acetyltransferase/amino-acid acetyltransferase ArgJ [Algiphilus sp.]|uniref:bifunctional glutamate N-acetyltransferase/amino-acid acetyltransferase ArgJ n=1 Tax=Algiphilus sp. TaxID=1872431 RepID=UPI0025BF9AAE|nr:bifunctional glutamate N-acetyltransferase/amino-acid acetyltransferase ArgJ [Algiphilus sp.]MCK5768985.1 bifunctional glutamate N-acetyltransferase/amino-acid acetyltransferase ArgJ [Algiphilus sp.]